MTENHIKFWYKFLDQYKIDKNTLCSGELNFGTDAESSAFFLQLVLTGQKTISFNALDSYKIDNEAVPQSDTWYILTDFSSNPKGVVHFTDVQILPFNSITWELAQKDGSCSSIEEWRSFQKEFFEDDGDLMGYEFSENLPVVCEKFTFFKVD